MIGHIARQRVGPTPGPWKAEINGASPVKIVAGDDIVGYAIFGLRRNVDVEHDGGVPTAEANARLIAAAPELLDVARRVAERFSGTDAPLGVSARAAIAKAEGAESL